MTTFPLKVVKMQILIENKNITDRQWVDIHRYVCKYTDH